MSDNTSVSTEVASEIAVIESGMRSDLRGYFRDEGRQARLRHLYDARDAGTPPPARESDSSRRIAELTKMMGDRRSLYWRDAALQREFRDLISVRDGLEVEGDGGAAALQLWRSELPADVVAAFDEVGGFEGSVGRLHNAAVTIIAGLEDEQAAHRFFEAFDTLPTGVRSAVLRETGTPPSSFTKAATSDEMKTWGQLYGGPEMISAWGNRARTNVGIAFDRLGKIHDRLSAADRATWLHWQGHVIAPRALQCLLYALGSG